MSISSPRESNRVPAVVGTSNADGVTPINPWVDSVTHRWLVDVNASGANIASHFNTDVFTSTNGQTIFTASATVVADFMVHINGSLSTPVSEYTVSGNTLTLASGIPSGNIVVWKYIT